MEKNFEAFLESKFLSLYTGIKDKFSEEFERWTEDLDVGEVILYADEYAQQIIKHYEHID